jgi:hypothetical protein
MRSTWSKAIVVASLVALVVPARGYVFVSGGAGTKIKIKDAGPTSRAIQFRFTEGPGAPSGVGPFPLAGGANLKIFNTAGSNECVSYDLPMQLWTSRHQIEYRDKHLIVTPVKAMDVKGNPGSFLLKAQLKAGASQPLNYPLTGPQFSVGVVFTAPTKNKLCADGTTCASDADCTPPNPGSCQLSTVVSCANFTAPLVDQAGKFVSKVAPEISSCPSPTGPCSPSGAFLD